MVGEVARELDHLIQQLAEGDVLPALAALRH